MYTDSLRLEEWHLYGSSRIGIYQTNKAMAQRTVRIENGITTQLSNTHIEQLSLSRFYTERGAKRYELTNHLGNVLTVITDKKLPVCNGTSVSYFIADIVSATDYSPFGAPLAGRTWQAQEYRYGFNGKEKENEINGTGNAYDFGARIYDARLGKWLTCDPLKHKYQAYSPFCYAINNPLNFIDLDGNAVYIIVYADQEAAFKVAALTRQREIESGVGFDKKKDKVYVVTLDDISRLPAQISECINDASKNGYGKTVEFDVYSHGGYDGPIGNGQEKPGDCDFGKSSRDPFKQSQMTPSCWRKINFNFDEKRSIANFYHCKGASFAMKFLEYQPSVLYTGAPAISEVSASYSLSYYDDAIGLFMGTDEGKNVWMISQFPVEEGPKSLAPMAFYEKDWDSKAQPIANEVIISNGYVDSGGKIRGKKSNSNGYAEDTCIENK
ncbi:MAG: hypothetical protein LCH37_12675 [Bacteroidetes bacterium]|nr:hypothetical protein [Bacteroidota bacterium]